MDHASPYLVKTLEQIVGVEAIEQLEGTEGTDKVNDILSYYLNVAASKVLNRRYPFGAPVNAVVEDCYRNAQLEIAVYLFNKRGAEGESLHTENGVQRSYGMETDVPFELLQQITPKGRVC